MVALTQSPLDPRRIEAAVSWTGAGAVLTFLGNTRDSFEGRSRRSRPRSSRDGREAAW